jgi:hypothetical protein
VLCRNKEARKRLAESNGTPAVELEFESAHADIQTKDEQNKTHIDKHAT